MTTFKDRFDAARQLADRLKEYNAQPNTIIIAIPRGGLELGSVLSQELHLPLDVVFTKKIGYPGNPEYAIGAVSPTQVFINEDYANNPLLQDHIAHEVASIRALLHERAAKYRGDTPACLLKNKTVIVTDDGVATGSTLRATLSLIKHENPAKIIVALPVCPPEALKMLQHHADEVICLLVPSVFFGVGQFYENFRQVDDQEAIDLLQKAQRC
jgi:predicted phosphoribosyltransferase